MPTLEQLELKTRPNWIVIRTWVGHDEKLIKFIKKLTKKESTEYIDILKRRDNIIIPSNIDEIDEIKLIRQNKFEHKLNDFLDEDDDYNRLSLDEFNLTDDDFNILPEHGHLNELENLNQNYKNEVKQDRMNNHLMERLNSNIHIVTHKNDKKVMTSPYQNNSGNDYASIHQNEISPNDFTSTRFIK